MTTDIHKIAVEIPDNVFSALRIVQQSGRVNMFDAIGVVIEMRQVIHWHFTDLNQEAEIVSAVHNLRGYYNLLMAFEKWLTENDYVA